MRTNHEFWFEHEFRQYAHFTPDAAALKALAARITLASGRDSRTTLPYRPNTVLAEQLGTDIVEFPGGHVGYLTHPAEFAAQLAELLASAA